MMFSSVLPVERHHLYKGHAAIESVVGEERASRSRVAQRENRLRSLSTTPVKTGSFSPIFLPLLCFRVIDCIIDHRYRTDRRIEEVRKQSEVEEVMGQTAVARGWVVGLVGRW